MIVEEVPVGEIVKGDEVLITGQLGTARLTVLSRVDEEEGCVLNFTDDDDFFWVPSRNRDYTIARIVSPSDAERATMERVMDPLWAVAVDREMPPAERQRRFDEAFEMVWLTARARASSPVPEDRDEDETPCDRCGHASYFHTPVGNERCTLECFCEGFVPAAPVSVGDEPRGDEAYENGRGARRVNRALQENPETTEATYARWATGWLDEHHGKLRVVKGGGERG